MRRVVGQSLRKLRRLCQEERDAANRRWAQRFGSCEVCGAWLTDYDLCPEGCPHPTSSPTGDRWYAAGYEHAAGYHE